MSDAALTWESLTALVANVNRSLTGTRERVLHYAERIGVTPPERLSAPGVHGDVDPGSAAPQMHNALRRARPGSIARPCRVKFRRGYVMASWDMLWQVPGGVRQLLSCLLSIYHPLALRSRVMHDNPHYLASRTQGKRVMAG